MVQGRQSQLCNRGKLVYVVAVVATPAAVGPATSVFFVPNFVVAAAAAPAAVGGGAPFVTVSVAAVSSLLFELAVDLVVFLAKGDLYFVHFLFIIAAF